MKSLKQDIKSGIVIFVTIATLWIITVFAANWYDSILVTTGETLTATKWNTLAKATTPTWAIMAFNLTACPDTWTEYLPARGRFLRGIDSTWVNDSIRTLWDLQTDSFQGHFHNVYDNNNWSTDAAYWHQWNSVWMWGWYTRNTTPNAWWWMAKESISDGTNWTPRIATETRPKNVAVLYCVKQ